MVHATHVRAGSPSGRRLRGTAAAFTTAALAATGVAAVPSTAVAADPPAYRLVGSFQTQLGCADNWLPECEDGLLTQVGDTSVYALTAPLSAGRYAFKVLDGDSWEAPAWGANGSNAAGSPNIDLGLGGDAELRFTFDTATGKTTVTPVDDTVEPATEADAPAPVRQPGSDEQFYFVLTDRFANGDPSNDTGGLVPEGEENDRSVSGFDPTDKAYYHGGDIAGLRANLDYIEGLGSTAIWLTPSFKNRAVQGTGADQSAGYHGYWITDFTQIDPHLGTNAELDALIDEAHARDIKVYFDIIVNHTADIISYEEGEYTYRPTKDAAGNPVPAYTPVIPVGLEDIKVPAWLNDSSMYNNRGNSTWQGESAILGDFDGLDDLDTKKQDVVDGFVDIYEHWATSGIDGFRIDTAKHVDFSFWEQWTTAIKEATADSNPDFFMFGEVYDADPAKLSPYLRNSDMDAVLDFTFQDAAAVWAQGGKASNLTTLFEGDDYYTTATKNAHSLPTFLGNHDMGRIGYFVKDKDAAQQRSQLAHSLMYLTRGQPVVYYGDEQGFAGAAGDGKDKNARQSLFASQVDEFTSQKLLDGETAGAVDRFDTDAALYKHIAGLAALRSAHPALSSGAQIEQHADPGAGIYAFSRVDTAANDMVEYVVAVNNATTAASATFTALTPGATFTGLYGTDDDVTSGADGTVTVEVPALSAVVLKAGSPLVADAESIAPQLTTVAPTGGLRPLADISVDLGTERYAETSIYVRGVGTEDWKLLGTDDTTTPRVFFDAAAHGYKDGDLLQVRAVVRDAAGNLSQTSTVAVVGNDHGAGYAAGSDVDNRLTIPGSHGTEIGGCADWTPGCASTALTERDNGSYAGTFDIAAGSYSYKFAFGTEWGRDYDSNGTLAGGENYAYTHAGGPITFYFDPITKLGANTAEGPVLSLVGSFSSQTKCGADWKETCLDNQLKLRGDGTYRAVLTGLEPGAYDVKAVDGLSWDTAYGAEDGGDVSFEITEAAPAAIATLDLTTGVLSVETGEAPSEGPEPLRDAIVSIAGSLTSEMGCAADWDATCVEAELTERIGANYSATFTLPAGDYEYKAIIGHAWDENYGRDRDNGGANIALSLDAETDVTFVYDDESHFVTAIYPGSESRFATIAGTIQPQLGCAASWAPACLGSWLQNWDRDGVVYTYETNRLKKGTYEAKAALDKAWAEGYPGSNVGFTVPTDYAKMVFTLNMETKEFTAMADTTVAGEGSRAVWLDSRTVALPVGAVPGESASRTWTLYSAPEGGLSATKDEVTVPADALSVDLTQDASGLAAELREKYPHLASYVALELPESLTREELEEYLTGQLFLVQRSGAAVEYATGVQIAPVLDDVFAAVVDRDLGATWAGDVPTLAVWAPTARSVTTLVWTDGDITSDPTEVPAERQTDGSWVTAGAASWKDKPYKYDIEVYVPSTGKVEHNIVTDPYSVGLTLNSTHSVLVDLADPAYRPTQWATTKAPKIARDVDRSIAEQHIRDVSITDPSGPAAERGTYLAFAGQGDGVKHLRKLAAAGLNTVHLLPSFDIATIEEDHSKQATTGDLSGFAPDSEEQQAAVDAIKDADGFNWGYDPMHYTAPEGSYASVGNQDGGARVAEYRTMVGALHKNGLQVVQDVVYNHTAASGQDPKSVLDRVVPGYYQRLSATGGVETSTCCSNVATENLVAQKLMVDSVVTWAKQYRIDGFRFDLMGHHSKANMLAVREALDELTLSRDGVDGKSIYLYGEGWNFGEVADNARFEQATQGQLNGTGIGTFSDRLRDAVHGGSPVDGGSTFQQGFGTGLGTDPNGNKRSDGGVNDGSAAELADLAHQSDLVRLGLAGNLEDFTFVTSSGAAQRGDELDYRGAPAGYASEPGEVVTYVDAHDNETLFDLLTLKLPTATSMADRVRMNTLSLATTTLSQTPTFWHAGTDLLRSKSLDRDSYNSGDHFNKIDWSGQSNNFGVGLPSKEKNEEKWGLMRPLLADPALKPSAAEIAAANAQALDLLRLRYSTPLLRLGSADLIKQKVSFPGSGADATPGLLVMRVDDTVGTDVDPALDGVLVVFNASPAIITEKVPGLAGRALALSQVQKDGADAVVKTTTWDAASGTVTVPGRTVAVLTQAKGGPVEPVKVASTTTLTTTTETAIQGDPVTVDVVVTADGVVPTGTVEVREGSTVVASGTLVAGRAKIGLPGSFTTSPGARSLVAVYSGSDTVAGSSSAALKILVKPRPAVPVKARSTTVLSPASRTTKLGTKVTWDVRVRSTQPVTGKVEIRNGKKVLGSATVKNGVAKVKLSKKAAAKLGRTKVRAYYLGSSKVEASSSAVGTLKVTKASAKVKVKVSGVTVGKRVKVKVSVTAPAGKATGTVKVVAGGKTLGKARIKKGKATIMLPRSFTNAAKTKAVTVKYSGSSTVSGKSTTVKVKVTKAARR